MGNYLSLEAQQQFQRQPNEKQGDFILRVITGLEVLDPLNPNPVSAYESDHQIVQAWDGSRFVEMFIPDSEFRATSENQDWIPPFHLRDDNDDMIGFVVPDEDSPDGASEAYFYLANSEVAAEFAQFYLNECFDTEFITINNAYSNTVGSVDSVA